MTWAFPEVASPRLGLGAVQAFPLFFFFFLRWGHRVTVKLLSGGSTSGISLVGSGEHFVFSLNKKRKRKHLQDSHLPGERGLGLLPWLEKACFPSGVWPGPSGDGGAASPGTQVLVGKRTFLVLKLLHVLRVFS